MKTIPNCDNLKWLVKFDWLLMNTINNPGSLAPGGIYAVQGPIL